MHCHGFHEKGPFMHQSRVFRRLLPALLGAMPQGQQIGIAAMLCVVDLHQDGVDNGFT